MKIHPGGTFYMEMENHFKNMARLIKSFCLLIVLLVIVFFLWRQFFSSNKKGGTTTVGTSSRLEKILQISELSTYQVTFNGVADINDDAGNLLFYTAYQAKVSIGLDMEKIQVSVTDPDEPEQKITVTLPEIEISDVNVDPGSLDYIFADSSADTDTVSITALPACKADAEAECRSDKVMFALARENAVNTIEALMQPFLAQNKQYQLEII